MQNSGLQNTIVYNPNVSELPPAVKYVPESAPLVQSTNIGMSEINDIRMPNAYRGVSFSKYKKTDVRTQFIDAMSKGKIEPACYWCAELICSGHFVDVWEIIFHYMAKHIHLGNPKIAIYLEMRYNVFRNIIEQKMHASELDLRNNEKIRNLFAEIVCTLTLSSRKPSFEKIKITRAEEFDITQINHRLKATSMNFAQVVFRKKDPKELFIALNEFAFCISETKNMTLACYWIEWAIEFESICKTKKQPCVCERRIHPVENKYQKDVIWLFWDALLHYCDKNNKFIEKVMNALLCLFCVRYTTATCKKRRYILYYAIGLLTESTNMSENIISEENKPVIQNVLDCLDEIYKQIKKNEESPKTEYLFQGLDKKKLLERSIRQMEMVNQMDQNTV
jgi:hypothetical protein